MNPRFWSVSVLLPLFVACSSGDPDRPGGVPSPRQPTATSGVPSPPEDGPASNNDPATGGPCTEFTEGGFVDPLIGGSLESQIIVQSVADYAGRIVSAEAEVTSICNTIAQDLDARADQRAAADAKPDSQAKLDAWCKLATAQLAEWRAKVGGSRTVDAPAATCTKPNVAANCNSKCTGRPREAECNKACAITAAANVACSTGGGVKVSIVGAASAADAAKVKGVIEANGGELLLQKAVLDGLMMVASDVSSTKYDDVKDACIAKASASRSRALGSVASASSVLVDLEVALKHQ